MNKIAELKKKIEGIEEEIREIKEVINEKLEFEVGEEVYCENTGEHAYVLCPDPDRFILLMKDYASPQYVFPGEWTSNGLINEEIVKMVRAAASYLEGKS